MASIRCPACGREGNVPSTYLGKSVRCPKCGVKIKLAMQGRLLLAVVVVVVVLAVGAASFFAFRHFFGGQAAGPGPALAEETSPDVAGPAGGDPDSGKKSAEELLALLAERRKQQEERRRKEEDVRKQEEERLTSEREQQRKEKEERELLTKQEQERILAEKKSPKLSATLEEIDKAPDKFYGKFLIVERVVIKGTAIDRHKTLERYTLGATTERNNYFTRVPLSGLLLSTTDQIAVELQRKIGTMEPYPRCKLFCEIRKWERRVGDDVKLCPEAHVYRVEIHDAVGRLLAAMGE